MHPTFKQLSVVIATSSALALGLSACNKPALQSSATGTGAPATTASARPPADNAVAAAEPLKEMVTAALVAEPGLGQIAVDVNPTSGTVTLTGTTNNEENRTKASQIALNVPGVKSVENNLIVKELT